MKVDLPDAQVINETDVEKPILVRGEKLAKSLAIATPLLVALFLLALTVHLVRGRLWLVGEWGVWLLLAAVLASATARYFVTKPQAVATFRTVLGKISPYGWTVGGLTLFGFWIRVWGQKNGLPYIIPADENLIVDVGTRLLKTGDFDPNMYYYPSFYLYLQSAVAVLHFLWGSFTGLYQSVNDLPDKTFAITTAPQMVLWQRTFTALFGAAAIPLAYFTVKKIWNEPRAGVLAAGFIACSHLATEHSHYVAVDMPMATLALAALYPAWKIVERGAGRDYLLAGAVAALSFGVKWNGITVIVLPVVAHFLRLLRTRPDGWIGIWHVVKNFFTPPLFWIILAFGATFLATTPYIFARIRGYSDAFGTNSVKYRLSQSAYATDTPWLGNLAVIWEDSAALFVLGAAGAILLAVRGKAAGWLALSFALAYFVSINNYRLIYPRNVLPLTLFWALFAGVFCVWLFDLVIKRLPQIRLNAVGKTFAAFGLPLLLLLVTMGNTVDRTFYANQFNDQPFSYERVERFFKDEIGAGALLMVEMRPQQWGAYPNILARFPDTGANDFDLRYYQERGVQYLAINRDRAAGVGYGKSYPELLKPELIFREFETKTILKPGPPYTIVKTGVTPQTLKLQHNVTADFNGKLKLLGFNAGKPEDGRIYLPPPGEIKPQTALPTFKAGEILGLTLYWQVLDKVPGDYTVFIHLRPINQPDVNIANRDTPPLNGVFPTSRWKPGDIVTDSPNLFLPPELPAGDYNLVMGLYLNDGKFTPLLVNGGNSVMLGKMKITR
jgi:hypothetical protein